MDSNNSPILRLEKAISKHMTCWLDEIVCIKLSPNFYREFLIEASSHMRLLPQGGYQELRFCSAFGDFPIRVDYKMEEEICFVTGDLTKATDVTAVFEEWRRMERERRKFRRIIIE